MYTCNCRVVPCMCSILILRSQLRNVPSAAEDGGHADGRAHAQPLQCRQGILCREWVTRKTLAGIEKSNKLRLPAWQQRILSGRSSQDRADPQVTSLKSSSQ